MLAVKSGRRRFPCITLDSIRGFLAYQPRPIPFFNKTLPANGSILAGTLFISLNFFYLFFNIHFKEPDVDVIILSHRASLVFIVNLPLLYLFSAKTQPLSFITGYSYESLNILHRRLGELLCLAAFLHGLLMFAGFFTLFRHVRFTLYTFIVNRTVLTGISALIVYEMLYFLPPSPLSGHAGMSSSSAFTSSSKSRPSPSSSSTTATRVITSAPPSASSS